ncbi:uncharacterized protein DUF4192 [Humibacillus xanthopallidus]|uniref:Uncharacterized protein DUF4192 n=1 Tax=Humibacillus xanthopallidus TaxID=412689 RepID=A0A543PWX6_9MICO|nr:DUF4192 domain-containing protein [Humibacillus xanthopallidus]TQN48582.1 uncharacterized protein DUF4192 [Humibacillus xanthopallidus]
MSEARLVLRSMSEVVAAVPHFLGVHPQESLVVVPEVTGDTPVARVNLPRDAAQSAAVAEGLARAYAGTGVGVVLLAYTEHSGLARQVCETVRERLEPAVAVIGAVAVDGVDWVRLDGPHRGQVSQSERDLMTAEFLLRGRPTPFASPEQLRQAYASSHPIPQEHMDIGADRAATAARGGPAGHAEREWITATLDRAAAGHTVLPDPDAARLISDVQHVPLRDHAWASMERDTASRHAELWRDLLTRSPDDPTSPASPDSPKSPVPAVAPVASLTAFAHWLDGDAVKARVALDRIPPGTSYQMARLVNLALEVGMNPRAWTPRDDFAGSQPDESLREESQRRPSVGQGQAIREPPKPPDGCGRDGPPR